MSSSNHAIGMVKAGHSQGIETTAAVFAQDRKNRGAGEMLSTSHHQAPNSHIENWFLPNQLKEVKIPSIAETIVLRITTV